MKILRQKEYALRVKNNKVGKVISKPLENLRERMKTRAEKKLGKLREENRQNRNLVNQGLNFPNTSRTKELNRALRKEGLMNGDLAIIRSNNGDNKLIRSNNIRKKARQAARKKYKSLSKEEKAKTTIKELEKEEMRDLPKPEKIKAETGKNVVSVSTKNPMILAHEIGHHLNSTSKNPVTRMISNLDLKVRGRYNHDKELSIPKRAIFGFVVKQEERNATRNGLKLLKKVGATPEELKQAKKDGSIALNSYKITNKGKIVKSLRDKLNKPWIELV